jgi:hypothetical protein
MINNGDKSDFLINLSMPVACLTLFGNVISIGELRELKQKGYVTLSTQG